MKISNSVRDELRRNNVAVRGSVTWEVGLYYDTWGQRYIVLKRNGKIVDYYYNKEQKL